MVFIVDGHAVGRTFTRFHLHSNTIPRDVSGLRVIAITGDLSGWRIVIVHIFLVLRPNQTIRDGYADQFGCLGAIGKHTIERSLSVRRSEAHRTNPKTSFGITFAIVGTQLAVIIEDRTDGFRRTVVKIDTSHFILQSHDHCIRSFGHDRCNHTIERPMTTGLFLRQEFVERLAFDIHPEKRVAL